VLLALTSLLLQAAAAGPQAPAGQRESRSSAPGVLVIAIDALRADRIHAFGYDRETTPTLDSLAAEGTSFRQCFSTAPWLLPAHVSLLTGCDPNVARRTLDKAVERQVERNWFVPGRVPHVAVEWLAHERATAAFVDHPWLSELYGLHVGFERFHARAGQAPPRGLDASAAALLGWLRGLDRQQGWFAYLHVHDLERIWAAPDPVRDSLFPPREGRARILPISNEEPCYHAIPPSRWDGGRHTLGEYEARYDGALYQLDERLGRLFDELRALGRFGTTTIAVVGTFGVQFGEAGLYLDHGGLSVADLHVPLVIRPALVQGGARGRAIDDVVSTVDLAPTLFELEGFAAPGGMHGRSLARWLERGSRPASGPRDFAFATGGLQQGWAIFWRQWVREVQYPGEASSSGLVRTWFGDAHVGDIEAHRAELRERVYDRLATHPDASATVPEEALDRIRQYESRWLKNTDRMRRALHSTGLLSSVGRDELDELVRLGYLGSDWIEPPTERR
jgi:arylsulfatase A-like enzyme